jgi:hypothetical protein
MKKNIDFDNALVAKIKSRIQPNNGETFSSKVQADLIRLYSLEQLIDRSLWGIFTKKELCLIYDANNGCINGWVQDYMTPNARISDSLLSGIYANAEDHIRLNQADERWEVDGPTLLAKLRKLNLGQGYALCRRIAKFWDMDANKKLESEEDHDRVHFGDICSTSPQLIEGFLEEDGTFINFGS